MKKRIVVGLSGSSAPVYGIRLLETLRKEKKIETHLIVSESAKITLRLEAPDWTYARITTLAHHIYSPSDLAASISSGSFQTAGMVVIPCSMKTLGHIAHSTGDDLLTRAADVTLKERRKLVLMVRESPLHLGHLKNMITVTEMGGIIAPPVPAFYNKPKSVEDIVHHSIGRVLDLFDIEAGLVRRWE